MADLTFSKVEKHKREALSFEQCPSIGGQKGDMDHSVSLHIKERVANRAGEERWTSRSIGSYIEVGAISP